MIVVVIIAILAAIIIPNFLTQSKKAKGSSETSAMLAEILGKEQAYRAENNAYLDAALCPSTPPTSDQDFRSNCMDGSTKDYDKLRVNPTESKLRCSYQAKSYASGTVPSSTTIASCCKASSSTYASAESFVIVYAKCDIDGDGAHWSEYQMSSVDSTICKCNEGY